MAQSASKLSNKNKGIEMENWNAWFCDALESGNKIARWEKIDKAKAQLMLKYNTQNLRNPCPKLIAKYASEMGRGEWEANGESITFSKHGYMISGQHRLHAVIKSDAVIETVVAYNCNSTGMTDNQGKKKTLAQWFTYQKRKNAALLASACRWVVAYDKGSWEFGKNNLTVGNSEVIDVAQRYDGHIDDCVQMASETKYTGMHVSVLAAVLFVGTRRLTSPKDSRIAVWFCDSIRTGSKLSNLDAVLHLKNKFASQTDHKKLSESVKRALITMAWNKTVTGEECTAHQLRISLTGPKSTEFPTTILHVEEPTQ